jgi:hypothetical protein
MIIWVFAAVIGFISFAGLGAIITAKSGKANPIHDEICRTLLGVFCAGVFSLFALLGVLGHTLNSVPTPAGDQAIGMMPAVKATPTLEPEPYPDPPTRIVDSVPVHQGIDMGQSCVPQRPRHPRRRQLR